MTDVRCRECGDPIPEIRFQGQPLRYQKCRNCGAPRPRDRKLLALVCAAVVFVVWIVFERLLN
jgi:hypothetical protein